MLLSLLASCQLPVNSMKLAMLMALFGGVALSASARVILQNEHSDKSLRPGDTRNHRAFPGPPGHSRGNRRGTLLNFKRSRNATGALAQVEAEFGTDLVNRIIQNSDYKGRGGRSKLAEDLERDDDLGLDLDAEAVVSVCTGLVANASVPQLQAAAEIVSGLGPSATDPLAANAWTLQSRPTSAKKIWLDFKGGAITGSAWNSATGLATITSPPYDTDGNPGSFSTAELSDIVAIWRSVSEDYSPFLVDVTTISQSSNNPALYTRVLIGGDGAWYGAAGGVAYNGVFGQSTTYYQPAFVFPKNLGPDYPKYIWEAAAHEAGHTMGLSHDGTASVGYWQGNSANYGSIMGAGYYSQLTVWDKGEYVGANNLEDDTAIISSKLGYIPNGNGNSISTATALNSTTSGSTVVGTASGVVTQQNTPDVFSFTSASGTATINVQTVIPWSTTGWDRSDLDAKVDVYNSASSRIASINPAGMASTNGLGISNAAVTIPTAGTYYIAVYGAGFGAANTDTGYSSYGVRGQFALTVTYPAPAGITTPAPTPTPTPMATPSPPPPGPTASPTGAQVMSAQGAMSCSNTGTGTSKVYTCTANVVVKSPSGTLIPGASVTGRYTTQIAAAGFPTTYYTSTTDTNGKATMTTASSAPYAARAETFTWTSVTKTGYTWTGPLTVTMTFV